VIPRRETVGKWEIVAKGLGNAGGSGLTSSAWTFPASGKGFPNALISQFPIPPYRGVGKEMGNERNG
jgi:hypothetical protein